MFITWIASWKCINYCKHFVFALKDKARVNVCLEIPFRYLIKINQNLYIQKILLKVYKGIHIRSNKTSTINTFTIIKYLPIRTHNPTRDARSGKSLHESNSKEEMKIEVLLTKLGCSFFLRHFVSNLRVKCNIMVMLASVESL